MSSIISGYLDDAHLTPENTLPKGRDLSAAPTHQYDRLMKIEEDIKLGKADFFYGDAY